MSEKEQEIYGKFLFPASGELPDPKEAEIAQEHRDLSEQLVGEYKNISDKIKHLEALQESLRSLIMTYAKERRGTIPLGKYTLILKPRTGSTTTDYESYIRDYLGESAAKELSDLKAAVKEGKIVSQYIKQGKDSMIVEVQLNSSNDKEEMPEY